MQQRLQENPKELDELIAYTVERITGHKAEELTKTVKEVIDKNLGKDYHWPGNVRELAQCIRRVIIKHDYQGDTVHTPAQQDLTLTESIEQRSLDAQQLLTQYCTALPRQPGTLDTDPHITQLHRTTAKKHIQHLGARAAKGTC